MHAASIALAACLAFTAGPAMAQTRPSDAAQGMVGSWELSNADRDKVCNVTFKTEVARGGYVISFDDSCGSLFPAMRDVVAWTIGKRDVLLLNDAKGQPVLELLEVEAGTYEGLRPNEGRYVLQNAAVAAATEDRSADQMFGDWEFVRGGGRPICALTLESVAADADSFAISLKPGCDAAIMRFNPVAWRLDRGQLMMLSSGGESWRFQESDATTWRRVPEARQPMLLVRQ
jgi:hypothetical protein